ncbi:MAG: MoaD/ThiS family protein [Candidatus Heimdallarchaeota archaeon]|nr:MoaD/ThiS family protein [Candidatus Heimdallarchaeota archaeon]
MTTENIKLSIRFFALLREIVGTSKISINTNKGNSIIDIIEYLTSEYQELKEHLYTDGSINSQFIYILNGENITSLEEILTNSDELAILPPSGGG